MNFIFYNKLKEDEILNGYLNKTDEFYSKLFNKALNMQLCGNVWKKYLAYLIVSDENPFSLLCENKGIVSGDINLVYEDMEKLYKLYNESFIDFNYKDNIVNFNLQRDNNKESYRNYLITLLTTNLDNAQNYIEFYEVIYDFYKTYGIGEFAFNKAFRIDDDKLCGISDVLLASFDDLIGYEWQKNRLIENTKAFINGKECNNTLLYGDSGTGKSTSIRSLIDMFYKDGLRIIEVYKHQMSHVAKLIASLKYRHYKFIIYMDDLSFEESEIEYKYLKSLIEGGLESKGSNILVYATSNRRHLIKETFKDNGEIMQDLHRNETKAEKLSLVARFGLQIYYMSLDNIEFRNLVKKLALKNNIDMPEEKLLQLANKFELRYGNLSGRTAQQFIKYISSLGDDL